MSKPDTKSAPKVVITVDGKLAWTVQQIAAKYGLERNSVATVIKRGRIPVAAMLDDKKAVYLADAVKAAMGKRPGSGWRKGTGYQPKPKPTKGAQWVTSDPEVMGGEPCIAGTRVPASTVAGLVHDGIPPAKVKQFYPRVSAAAARAAHAWWIEAGKPGA